MARIGIFICRCGSNIARNIDIPKLDHYATTLPGVSYVTTYDFICSEAGQRLITEAIRKQNLDGIVIAACTPEIFEGTFRRAVTQEGFNPYLVEVVNLREHCAWVHEDGDEATAKAQDSIRMMVEKTKRNLPLVHMRIPLTRRALIIGGGIAGLQAALDITSAGYEVLLIERDSSIGGHMAQLAGTYPTMDCSSSLLWPRMREVVQNRKIKLYTYSELEELKGYVGNFTAGIRKKACSVDPNKCTACGACQQQCPVSVTNEFDEGLSIRKAIYTPFPQAVPGKPVIDREHCLKFQKEECGLCQTVCPTGAINFREEDELITEEVGAVIVATGYGLLTKDTYTEYGYGRYPDLINSLQFERLINPCGPTQGELRRPSDGKIPQTVVFIQCAGSRDISQGIRYCSKICCLYTAKHVLLFGHKYPDGRAYVFYLDIRASGKSHEEFVRKAIEKGKATYIRGRVSDITMENNYLTVRGADTLSGRHVEMKADLVVLATALTAAQGVEKLARKLGITCDDYHFFSEIHPKLRPVETKREGIFLAGACQSPQDISDSVAQAGAAASKVLGLFHGDDLIREPLIARVNESTCTGCLHCQDVCPHSAIEVRDLQDRKGKVTKKVAFVNRGKCQGCGTCAAACRSKSIDVEGFTNQQIYAQIRSIGSYG
ncbi:MAG: FAD-dependent oxidoreductase [bacterium]